MTPTPQTLDALAKANRVRLGRASLKREIRAGERSLVPILLGTAEPEVLELAEPVPVIALLQWQHRWGKSRASRVLYLLGISEGRRDSLRLTHLSEPRRRTLVALCASGHTTEAQAA